jgi:hypothetical protein
MPHLVFRGFEKTGDVLRSLDYSNEIVAAEIRRVDWRGQSFTQMENYLEGDASIVAQCDGESRPGRGRVARRLRAASRLAILR